MTVNSRRALAITLAIVFILFLIAAVTSPMTKPHHNTNQRLTSTSVDVRR